MKHCAERRFTDFILIRIKRRYYFIPYNSLAVVVRLLAERSDTKSNVKLGEFRPQFQASYVSSHTE